MRLAALGRFALPATALAAIAGGCAPSAQLAAREAAQPAAIAQAMCSQYRPHDAAGCDKFRLPDRASEIAYAGCLDYNQRDLKPCAALRVAFEGDLHAALEAGKPPTASSAPPSSAGRTRVLRSTAAELFKASNGDADTFQAALLIPEIRRKVEAVLRQRLTDDALHALIDKTRAEAAYWFRYMQQLDRAS